MIIHGANYSRKQKAVKTLNLQLTKITFNSLDTSWKWRLLSRYYAAGVFVDCFNISLRYHDRAIVARGSAPPSTLRSNWRRWLWCCMLFVHILRSKLALILSSFWHLNHAHPISMIMSCSKHLQVQCRPRTRDTCFPVQAIDGNKDTDAEKVLGASEKRREWKTARGCDVANKEKAVQNVARESSWYPQIARGIKGSI